MVHNIMNVELLRDFVIRPATNADRERIFHLVEEILAEFGLRPDSSSSEADLKDIERTYFKQGGLFEVVENRDGSLLGTYGVLPLDRYTCKLRKMYLVPKARGLGLGRWMLERAVAHTRGLGCHILILETVSSMKDAIRLYTRAGFRPIEQKAQSARCDQVYSLDLLTQGITAVTNIDDIRIRNELMPGDLGYVIYLHGLLYGVEYGYGVQFESYVAEGLHEFYEHYDPAKDRIWVCEHNNKIIGFLLLMHRENNAAQLRYFLIVPEYRGIGLGKRLMDLYMEFLHRCEYRSSYLWTTHELTAAASLYKKHGFKLTEEKESTVFGKPLREQRYDWKK